MRIPDEYANRTVKCPKCGQAFRAVADGAPSPVAAAAPAAPAKTVPSTPVPSQEKTGKSSSAKVSPAAPKPAPSTPIPPGKSAEKLAASPTVKKTAPPAKPKPPQEVAEVDVDEAVEEEEVNVEEAVEEEEVDVDEAVEEEGEEGSAFRSPLLKDDPFEDHEDLPDWFVDLIKAELSKKENIVWIGRPSMRVIQAQAWIAMPIGLVLIVGAIVALIFSGTVTEFGLFLGLLLGGLFILLIGSAFTAAPWLVSLTGKYRAVYVLTTRRALIWEAVTRMRNEEMFSSYLVPQLVKMERRESALVKGAGDLVFGERIVVRSSGGSSGGTRREKQPVGFLKMDDVRTVEKMIRETLLDERTDALFS